MSSQPSKSMDVDPTPFRRSDFESDEISVGLPAGDYTLGTRYPSHTTIKVAPLDHPPTRCAEGMLIKKLYSGSRIATVENLITVLQKWFC